MKKLSLLVLLFLIPSSLQVFSSETMPIQTATSTIAVTAPKELTMNKAQVARVIAAAGFPRQVVPIVTCLAKYESHFKPNAVNDNENNSHDYGLLQINSIWLKTAGCNTSVKNILDPEQNAKCALKIYKTQGLTAWTTYKTFRNTCLAYQVEGFNSASEEIVDAKIPHADGLM